MGKLLVRLTVTFTAIYFVLSYIFAQFFYVDILTPLYNIPFELCVVVYSFSEGKYHCKYIKYTALAILVSDVVTQTDNMYNYLTIDAHNYIPLILIILSVFVSCIMAIKHFIKVIKIKKMNR
mgnify:CR=1 FL=1